MYLTWWCHWFLEWTFCSGTQRHGPIALPPPKSRSRPWYWPFGKPKYNQMQTRENDTEEYELGGLVYWAHWKDQILLGLRYYRACYSPDKNDCESKMTLKLQFIHCLPQGFTNGIDHRVQQEKGQQREWVIGVLICTFCASILEYLLDHCCGCLFLFKVWGPGIYFCHSLPWKLWHFKKLGPWAACADKHPQYNSIGSK